MPSEIADAHRGAPIRRFAMLKLLQVNEAVASAEDLTLARRVQSVATPEAYDTALADKRVNDLFVRGVLHFGRTA